MNVEVYKRVLLDLRTSFSARLSGDAVNGSEQRLDVPGDAADAAVVDESASEDFSEAELDWAVLTQIEAALRRIDEGTYGRCAVDGAPIEQARLDAVPWAEYCVKHQMLREAASRPSPTL
jgi:DnaK suppressor protein